MHRHAQTDRDAGQRVSRMRSASTLTSRARAWSLCAGAVVLWVSVLLALAPVQRLPAQGSLLPGVGMVAAADDGDDLYAYVDDAIFDDDSNITDDANYYYDDYFDDDNDDDAYYYAYYDDDGNSTDDDDYYYYDDDSDDDDDDDSNDGSTSTSTTCLAITSMLRVLRDGDAPGDSSEVRVDEVRVGDLVQAVAMDGTVAYAPVVYKVHARDAEQQVSTLVTIHTSGSQANLQVSQDHLIPMIPCALAQSHRNGDLPIKYVMARSVQLHADQDMCILQGPPDMSADVGSPQAALQVARVTNVRLREHRKGFMSIVTANPSGLIVADDHVVSSFGLSHDIPNLLYSFHRLVYRLSPEAAQAEWLHWLTETVVGKTVNSLLAVSTTNSA